LLVEVLAGSVVLVGRVQQQRQQLLALAADQEIGHVLDATAWSLLRNLLAVSAAPPSHDRAIGHARDAVAWFLLLNLLAPSAAPQRQPYAAVHRPHRLSLIGPVRVVVTGNSRATPTAGNAVQSVSPSMHLQLGPHQVPLVIGHVQAVVIGNLLETRIAGNVVHIVAMQVRPRLQSFKQQQQQQRPPVIGRVRAVVIMSSHGTATAESAIHLDRNQLQLQLLRLLLHLL